MRDEASSKFQSCQNLSLLTPSLLTALSLHHLIQIEDRQQNREHDEKHHRTDQQNHRWPEHGSQCAEPAIELALLMECGFTEHARQLAGTLAASDETQRDRREQAAF